ncbi:hypothetical protein M427DRAFT_55075 [Gonapodya prolifera JEL478]|uniref:PB1 domain-containing protein n=1 Tax=Gonapodya prolifera (strain JEL478) TaxID=1344416 RepID=A0A139AJX5_GONPJ|nr:hypothetical protein M427DRAFT_55075 [Gonapodya prolifera JEL478]|eukprot:KXS17069.1 hypothetical protein M427DRAFT_55075 [Gonapodya prolifera JEL478]
MPRTIKLSHESVIRKVTVAEDAEWDQLDKQVKNLFGIPESDVLELAYRDEDGDVVSLNTTQELRDAVFSGGDAAKAARFEVKAVGGKGKKIEFAESTSLYPDVPLVALIPSPFSSSPISPPPPAATAAPVNPAEGSPAPSAEPEPIQEVVGGERSTGSGPKTEDFLEGVERIGGEITSFVQTQLNSFLAATSTPPSGPTNTDPRNAEGAPVNSTVASTPILQHTVSLQYRPDHTITYAIPAWTSHPFVLVPLLLGVMHALGKAGKVLPSLFAASLFAKRNRGSKFYGSVVPLMLVIFGLKALWWLMIPMTIGAAIMGLKRMKRRMWQRRAAAWGPAGQWAGNGNGFRGWDQPREGQRQRRGWRRGEANAWGPGSSSDEGWY